MTEEVEPEMVLTGAELQAWIGEVEDKAWAAQSDADACRFLLGNLLAYLQTAGVMNAGDFIASLRQRLPADMDNEQQRLGIEDLLNDLTLFFHQPKGSEGTGSSGDVFH